MAALRWVVLLLDLIINDLGLDRVGLYNLDFFRLVDWNRVFIVVVIYNDRHNIVDLINGTRNRQLGAIRVLERGL